MSQQPDQFGNPNDPPSGGGGAMKIVLIIFGVLGGIGLLTCGCCAGMAYWGVGELGKAVTVAYGDHELVQEHIGDIQDISANFTASGEVGGGANVFDVTGTKGSGQIVVYDQVNNRFGNAELRVGGETYELGPGGP